MCIWPWRPGCPAPLHSAEPRISGVQEAPAALGRDSSAPFPSLHVSNCRRHGDLPPPQPVPSLGVGVSRVVVRAARDKGRLSDTLPDLGHRFPDACPAADSRPGGPQCPQPAAPARPPRGVGSEGGVPRGGAESTFPLKPRRNVGGFPETRPRPPAGPPAPHLDLLPRELQEGLGAHLGDRGQVLLPLPPPAASCSGNGGGWASIKPSYSCFRVS